jgi:hypothetical protein
MWESKSPVRSFSTAAAAIEASASGAAPASGNNDNTPTKHSLAWFRSRQAQWNGSPRPKMQALPPPLPPYTPPKTIDVSVELKRPVTATATDRTTSLTVTSSSTSSTTSVSTRQQPPISQPPSMQRATAHPTPSFPSAGASFAPTMSRQSLISTTTATKQQQNRKEPELEGDTTAAASTATAAIDYRQFLVDFYTQHNPSKLATVDQTLVTYEGRYEEMAAKLTAKYVTKAAAAAVPSPYGLPTGTGPLDALWNFLSEIMIVPRVAAESRSSSLPTRRLWQWKTFESWKEQQAPVLPKQSDAPHRAQHVCPGRRFHGR